VDATAEVVIVDDGSTDDTPRIVQRFAAGQPAWKVVRRPQASSPSCARNTGANLAGGDILFFLDGDDLFLPTHLLACWRALQEPNVEFVKTGVRLVSSVHLDWKDRIENSIVLNLAIRRRCHEAIGGFPDYLLCRRDEERLVPQTDVFYKIEDMFYNRLVERFFHGRRLPEETVEYCRHPGNAYDRQYEKFRRPFGAYAEVQPPDERFRMQLGEVILQGMLPRLEQETGRRLRWAAGASPLLEAAQKHLRAGDLAVAERLCRQAVQAQPRDADAWRWLGDTLRGRGSLAEAIDAYQRSLQLHPDAAETHHGLGLALAAQGQHAPAVAHLREAVRLRPEDAETLAQLGVALAESGQRGEAIACFEQALRRHPESATTHNNLGIALAQEGRLTEAVANLERALQVQPEYAEACYNLASVLQQLGRRDDAIARFQECLRLQPNHAGACNNLGLALTEAKRQYEALIVLQHAVRLRPDMKEAHNNLGLAYTDLGRFAEAQASFQQALRLDSRYAEAHSNLGSAYKEQGRLEEAVACYDMALRLAPEAVSTQYNRSLALLQQGDYERGWPAYEWRWQRPPTPPRPFAQPRWDGAPRPEQTILLWSEQGLGDTIQFVRYAALVKERVGQVVLECPPPLVALLSSCPGVDQVVAEGEPLPNFDVQAPLLSLPALCGTTLSTVPAQVPYLQADPARVASWRARLAGESGFRIGVVWQGNPRHGWDRHRSLPLASLETLSRVKGVRLVSLQKGPGREQIAEVARRFAVLDLGGELDESSGAFVDTAAVMQCLDLVVTVDTAAAHVVGALGVPVWLALAAIADWRWLRQRDDTPWYPSMRLFRQERLGDWRTVFTRMADELRPLVAAQSKSRIVVGVVPGELIDRITILEIKSERLSDPQKRTAVLDELAALRQARDGAITPSAELKRLTAALRAVNEDLWDSEDRLRLCERADEFGPAFVEEARSVYLRNDRRAVLKQQINELLGVRQGEPKAYPDYSQSADDPARRFMSSTS
jgi:tetratricopeptide (TPR) repeat protein